jgi:hypothetical protein
MGIVSFFVIPKAAYSMVQIESGQKPRHAVVQSHRCLHSWFTPTHLTLGSTSDTNLEEPHAVWRSRRSRKARYTPVPHTIADDRLSKRSSTNGPVVSEMEKMVVALRVQTQTSIKPHLILDVTFWLAVTFTFGSAIWVVNGEFPNRGR